MPHNRRAFVYRAELFWKKVDKDGPVLRPELGACWIWKGSTSANGYGHLLFNKHFHNAQRVAWELTNGSIPIGMCALHQCDNPPCVRPSHLFLGTLKDNSQDAIRKGRWNPGKLFGRYGELNNAAKLTKEQVATIRMSVQNGIKKNILASEYSVDRKTIYNIVSERTWRKAI